MAIFWVWQPKHCLAASVTRGFLGSLAAQAWKPQPGGGVFLAVAHHDRQHFAVAGDIGAVLDGEGPDLVDENGAVGIGFAVLQHGHAAGAEIDAMKAAESVEQRAVLGHHLAVDVKPLTETLGRRQRRVGHGGGAEAGRGERGRGGEKTSYRCQDSSPFGGHAMERAAPQLAPALFRRIADLSHLSQNACFSPDQQASQGRGARPCHRLAGSLSRSA
jgi:hypothetical protein